MALHTGNIKFTATDTEPTEDKGRIYYDDSESALKHYNGDDWYLVNTNSAIVSATGGSSQTHGIYTSYTFTGNGSLAISGGALTSVGVFILGGGGSGGGGTGGYHGGGAGGGGWLVATSLALGTGTYNVVVGAGGAGSNGGNGSDGLSSSFGKTGEVVTSTGGGGGGSEGGGGRSGHDGGQGGGSCYTGDGGDGTLTAPSGDWTVYSNDGGVGSGSNNPFTTGGGGGAGADGGDGLSSAGVGGAGRSNDYRTGSNVTYSQGGNGTAPYDIDEDNEGANTGNGSDGTCRGGTSGSGNGGSGIVVIRILTAQLA